ncbi:MAG TPA: hypothetical protein VGW36_07855 [Pyrinomonadaceae bacterium]|nr:hypothetical protein [Pyrinomonadaceae bacterium]
MTTPPVSPPQAGPFQVAVIPRLVPAMGYGLAILGAGLGAMLIRRVLFAMREAESAGISAVSRAVAESNLPILVCLYAAAVIAAASVIIMVARMLTETSKASPSIWFFVVGGALVLLPVALVWWAESLLIGVFYPGSGGITAVAEMIFSLTLVVMIATPIVLFILLGLSVWPITSESKPGWGPLAGSIIVETLLIAAAIAFQIRTSWLYRVYEAETLLP